MSDKRSFLLMDTLAVTSCAVCPHRHTGALWSNEIVVGCKKLGRAIAQAYSWNELKEVEIPEDCPECNGPRPQGRKFGVKLALDFSPDYFSRFSVPELPNKTKLFDGVAGGVKYSAWITPGEEVFLRFDCDPEDRMNYYLIPRELIFAAAELISRTVGR